MPTPRDPEETLRQRLKGARPVPPPRDDAGGGGGDDEIDASDFHFPSDAPVRPLGADAGEFYFMDANRQFRVYSYKDFGGHGLTALFGGKSGQAYLDNTFPRYGAKGKITGLDKERAVRSLMAACAEKGVFDADNKLRNVGAWTDDDGRLLWHLGESVLVVEAGGKQHYASVGTIGGHVYPLGAPQPGPAKPDDRKQRAAVDQLYQTLQLWHWRRGELDARLQLGWIGCALIGGALPWRPAVWATGPQSTGKSTLHNHLIYPVLGGDGAAVKTSDASGAGIHQALRNRSLPVLFDELEPTPHHPRKAGAVIELARQAASGGRIIRGSADHGHREFVARATFLFSSILVPRLEPQDAMRIVVLNLNRIPEDAAEPKLEARALREIGTHLRRLLVDRWQFWPARLELWREGLRRRQFSARVADTWGTLLAMADHLLDPTPAAGQGSGDTVDAWCTELGPHLEELVRMAGSDPDRLIHAMLTMAVDPWTKGQKWPLSTLISVAAQHGSVEERDPDGLTTRVVMDHRRALSGLELLGMKVGFYTPPASEAYPDPQPVHVLVVDKDHTELNRMIAATKWGGGAYAQTLSNIPGAWSAQQRIARARPMCVHVPIEAVLPRDPEAAPGAQQEMGV